MNCAFNDTKLLLSPLLAAFDLTQKLLLRTNRSSCKCMSSVGTIEACKEVF